MFSKVILLALVVAASASNINRYQDQLQQMIKADAGKIVGGTEAAVGAWPWQVEMRSSSGSFMCGGSIVSDRWIMTAAHCCVAYGASPSNYRVRVGVHSRKATNEGAVLMTLSKVVVNPNYDDSALSNDFCLMKTTNPIVFTSKVAAVALPTASDGPVGKTCWVTGWGETRAQRAADIFGLTKAEVSAPRALADKLQQVDVAIISNTVCNAAYGNISPAMVCATAPGHDSCQGDSGGPMVCQDGANPYTLVGVVSFGIGCARPTYPGVYARTSTVLSWITSTMAT